LAGHVVVLDANVLYGIEVTDLLATMATRRLFRPHWSPQILDEVTRNLSTRHDLDPVAIERRIGHLNRALPDALTEVPESLIEAMPINDKDRHVLALAVQVDAPTIVTENLRDFPAEWCEPFGVEAVSADTFTLAQVHLYRDEVLASIDSMAQRRVRVPKTRAEIIERLSHHLPLAMAALQ
jgi:hypothetical protein